MFYTFFKQGFTHIVAIDALDHILFLLAIVAIYNFHQWKKILWVVTSFTIAHSITLALSITDILKIPSHITEFLIAFTILFTCIENLFLPKWHAHRVLLTGVFGLVHGLGFSNVLRGLFMGMEFSWLDTLLPFNLGIEVGQIVILAMLLSVIYFLRKYLKLTQDTIIKLFSIPVMLMSAYWMWERF